MVHCLAIAYLAATIVFKRPFAVSLVKYELRWGEDGRAFDDVAAFWQSRSRRGWLVQAS